ncbi:MAG: glycerate kinase [Actinomycetota bacterium]
MSRIVIAPDSFKGTISAAGVADALAEGWLSVDQDAEIVRRPMADGGEGTLDAFAAALPDAQRMPVRVPGPDGVEVDAFWLLLPDGTGVVELASTSGIEMLGERRAPWDADTSGFGRAIAAALDHGVTRLVVGIGSSASTDGGLGLLRELGASFTDAQGADVPRGARGLTVLASADLSGLRPLPADGVRVLSDVTNPLLGASGAAAVFGPQKGLDGSDIDLVDAALGRWAEMLPAEPATPGAGAAGGTGFGLLSWGAPLVPGSREVAGIVDLPAAVAEATLVITGEGSFDGQSAGGKAPAHVAELAAAAGVPVALVAGRIADDTDSSGFHAVASLTQLAGSSAAALADPARWLRAAGAALARER